MSDIFAPNLLPTFHEKNCHLFRPLPINVSGDLGFEVLELGCQVSGFQLFICTRPIPGTEVWDLPIWRANKPGSEDWYQPSSSWYVRAASRRLLGTPTVERRQNEIYLYWRKYDVPKQKIFWTRPEASCTRSQTLTAIPPSSLHYFCTE